MNINKREKVLLGLLLVSALVVWMIGGEGDGTVSNEIDQPLVSPGRIFKQYRRIRPIPELKPVKPVTSGTKGRNIFQFGSRSIPDFPDKGPGSKTENTGNSGISASGEGGTSATLELSGKPVAPQPPEVDFQIEGIILAGPVRAAVITRTPELFVVRESQRFLKHFILKSVKRKGIVIGYTGFKDELFIPLKKDGGLQ